MSRVQICAKKTQKVSQDAYQESIGAFYHSGLYPCNLGIIFFDDESLSLFEELNREIRTVFDSCFSGIKKVIMEKNLSFSKSKERIVRLRTLKEVCVYPTNSFYEIISELKVKNAVNIGIGITKLPIYSSYVNNLIFLYGEAHLHHKCAIVSSYKLKYELNSSSNSTFQHRVIKEVIHELGHFIIGPKHCRNKLCVMSFSNNLGDIDNKAFYLCNECKCKLEKNP